MAPSPIGFAHRGARAELPDNTLAAFARAIELGATGLETDAWLSADGVVVLDHDGWFRQGWRRRPVRSLARSGLPSSVPSLAELYDRCGTERELSVDVKDPDVASALLGVAREVGAIGRLWLCSPDVTLLRAWRHLDGDVRLVHSTALRAIPDLGAHTRHLVDMGVGALNLHEEAWSEARVDEVHDAGGAAFAWDAQTPGVLRRLVGLAVDAVYSDHVATMMQVIAER